MRHPRLEPRWGITLVAMLALLVAGCGTKKNTLLPKLRPETSVFVQFTPGPDHAVNHLVHLYWFGTDVDGDVVAYDYRFIYPGENADTVSWARTRHSDSTFAVQTPDGVSTPTFEVRAIDNDGLIDLTPARQEFRFTNQPPEIVLVHRRLVDTTFASVTLAWTGIDRDGDSHNMRFRVWMNGPGNAAHPFITSQTRFTVPTAAFLEGGHLLAGPRTAYVQAIDDGGMLGALDSTTWYVRSPVAGGDHGRLLLIDDVTGKVANPFIFDSLYVNTARRNLVDSTQFSILRLTFSQPFQSPQDVEQTFNLFDAVIWYRGPQGGASTLIRSTLGGIAAYVDSGGKFMIEGLDMVDGHRAAGALDASFVSRYLGSDYLYRAPIAGEADSTVEWGIDSGSLLESPPFQEIPGDTAITIASTIITGGLRGFAVRDTHDVILWARAGNLSPVNDFDIPIAVSVPVNRARPAGGRFIICTFPLRSGWHPLFPGVPRILAKLFKQMGLAS